MPIVNVQQGSDEWKSLRMSKITSTMSSSIMQCNPFKSKLQLFNELVGLTEPNEPNEKMKLGTAMENEARIAYIKETGIIVSPCVYVSDDHPWALASLDGINHIGTRALEIKCGKRAFEQAKQGIIPDYYKCQMQFAMWVTSMIWMHYYAFWEGEGILMTVERDDKFIDEMIRECERFYNDLKCLKAPEIDPFEDIGISDKEWDENLKKTWESAQKDSKEKTPLQKLYNGVADAFEKDGVDTSKWPVF